MHLSTSHDQPYYPRSAIPFHCAPPPGFRVVLCTHRMKTPTAVLLYATTYNNLGTYQVQKPKTASYPATKQTSEIYSNQISLHSHEGHASSVQASTVKKATQKMEKMIAFPSHTCVYVFFGASKTKQKLVYTACRTATLSWEKPSSPTLPTLACLRHGMAYAHT
jgi:hypothetical protein